MAELKITMRPKKVRTDPWVDGHDREGLLVGLNAVDWGALQHAYGPAIDVPAQLLAVARDGDLAGEAMYQLWGNIHHQGSVYPATTPAVPFLAELACRPLRERASVIALLGFVGLGDRPDGPVWAQVMVEAPRVVDQLATVADPCTRGALIGLAILIGPLAAAALPALEEIRDPPRLAAGAQLAAYRIGSTPVPTSVLEALVDSDEVLEERVAEYAAEHGISVGDWLVEALLGDFLERLSSE